MNALQKSHRQRVAIAMALLCSLILVTLVGAQSALPPGLSLEWHSIDAGGGTSANAQSNLSITGTIGQLDASPIVMTSAEGFSFQGGFWNNLRGSCPGDVAPSGGDGIVNVNDLLLIIAAWGTSNPQYDIAPFPGGDGVINVNDLLAVINAWGLCH